MKAALAFGVGLALATLGSGCVSMAETVRRYAAEDLHCSAGDIRTRELPHGVIRAEGCGRHGYYMDNNAPATTTAPAQPGQLYWTVASNRR
jgi:hypothetical protein